VRTTTVCSTAARRGRSPSSAQHGWATLTGTTVTASTTDANLTIGSQGPLRPSTLTVSATIVTDFGGGFRDQTGYRHIDITLVTRAFTEWQDKHQVALQLRRRPQHLGNGQTSRASRLLDPGGTAAARRSTLGRAPPAPTRRTTSGNGSDLSANTDETWSRPTCSWDRTTSSFVQTTTTKFEQGPAVDNGPDVFFDGGVIEISADGGTTWKDFEYIRPGYSQTLFSDAAGATQ